MSSQYSIEKDEEIRENGIIFENNWQEFNLEYNIQHRNFGVNRFLRPSRLIDIIHVKYDFLGRN